jgi:hypothetical protein
MILEMVVVLPVPGEARAMTVFGIFYERYNWMSYY